jgi:bifunctional non-homologous end joining protein LigD
MNLREHARKRRAASSAHRRREQELAKFAGSLSQARRSRQPRTFKPQLATLASDVPNGQEWLHELKFDGYRVLAFLNEGEARLITRRGNDWTRRFGSLAASFAALPCQQAILDGEVVILDEQGISNFQKLQNSLKRGSGSALVCYLFDVPHFAGWDLTKTPLVGRKELLARLLNSKRQRHDGPLRFSEHIRGQGQQVWQRACRGAMEGIVSKRADSGYYQARTAYWLKVKCLKRQEFVIGGFTKPSGSRIGFGALLLGYYDGDELVYCGRVGTGFTHDSLRQLKSELKARVAGAPPFRNPPRGAMRRGVIWVKPQLVAEVEFTEWTGDGLLRHPSFQGLREDKPPKQVRRERPTS